VDRVTLIPRSIVMLALGASIHVFLERRKKEQTRGWSAFADHDG
jgi:hypothetical protein